MDIRIDSSFWWLWIKLLWTWEYKYLFKILFQILLDKSPEVGSLYHKIAEFLMFLTFHVFHSDCTILHAHQDVGVPITPHSHQYLLYSFILFLSLFHVYALYLPFSLSLLFLPSHSPFFFSSSIFLPFLLPIYLYIFLSFCHLNHCSVTKSCPALCNPNDCSTPGFPSLHCLLEFLQTHVHWVSDAIQPSYPLYSPSPPAFNLS